MKKEKWKKNNNNTQNHLNCNQNYVFFSTIILLSLVFLLTLLFSPYSHFGSSLVIPNTAKKTKAWREGENKSEKKIHKKNQNTHVRLMLNIKENSTSYKETPKVHLGPPFFTNGWLAIQPKIALMFPWWYRCYYYELLTFLQWSTWSCVW